MSKYNFKIQPLISIAWDIIKRAANNSCCVCCDFCLACDAKDLLRELGEESNETSTIKEETQNENEPNC